MAGFHQRGARVVCVADATRGRPAKVQQWLNRAEDQTSSVPDIYRALALLATGEKPIAMIVCLEAVDWNELDFFDQAGRLSPETRFFVASAIGDRDKLAAALGERTQLFDADALDGHLKEAKPPSVPPDRLPVDRVTTTAMPDQRATFEATLATPPAESPAKSVTTPAAARNEPVKMTEPSGLDPVETGGLLAGAHRWPSEWDDALAIPATSEPAIAPASEPEPAVTPEPTVAAKPEVAPAIETETETKIPNDLPVAPNIRLIAVEQDEDAEEAESPRVPMPWNPATNRPKRIPPKRIPPKANMATPATPATPAAPQEPHLESPPTEPKASATPPAAPPSVPLPSPRVQITPDELAALLGKPAKIDPDDTKEQRR